MSVAAGFVVTGGDFAKRKLWSNIGLYSAKGPTWGQMGRSFLRAALNSARNVHPQDNSPPAGARRPHPRLHQPCAPGFPRPPLPCSWVATARNKPPMGKKKMRWPGREPFDGAFPALFPSWQDFWTHPPGDDEPEVAAPAPAGEFLKRMRRNMPEPRIRVR